MNSNLRLIKILLMLISFISLNLYAQDAKEELRSLTTIEKPFELRDPFQAPLIKKSKEEKKIKSKVSTGVYNNIPSIGEIELAELQVVGVLIGKERRAVVRLEGKTDTFILKEGEVLGENQAELRAIVPGGIILVEKIINVYGEEEYLETVIPISK